MNDTTPRWSAIPVRQRVMLVVTGIMVGAPIPLYLVGHLLARL